jgi:hypothetical protein
MTLSNGMKHFKLIFLFLLSQPTFAQICHPKINPQLPQYIIGYGSLIDEPSKKRTDPSAQESFPVVIKGYKRSWSVHGTLPGLNTTFLSVFEDNHSSFNGVIYKLSHPENIQQYDIRERSYCRKELRQDTLKVPSSVLPDQKQIWIYISTQKRHEPPTIDYPIVQSYVDIFIRGCIQIEEKYKIKYFAKDCIQSTEQWSNHWVNDRIFPRRPFLYEPYAYKIDALVKETLPERFKHIKLDGGRGL